MFFQNMWPNTIIKHITQDLKCFFSYGLATNKATIYRRRQEQDESSNVQEAVVEEAVRALHPRSMLGDFGGIFGFWLGPYQDLVDPKKCFWKTHRAQSSFSLDATCSPFSIWWFGT